MPAFDYLILGSGMAALSLGAQLARAGQRVHVLEAHEHFGGYAHSFPMGGYRLCAQVHYVFGCEPGGAIHDLLDRVGLAGEVPFERLDPDGFEHVVVGGERYRIPSGFDRFEARLLARHPEHATPIRAFFRILCAARDELARMPEDPSLWHYATAPLRFPTLLRWRKATLGEVYDHVRMPSRLRAVLAGQAGDYLLPPSKVAFLLHVALVSAYDRGAFYPKGHYGDLVDRLVETIRAAPGCAVSGSREVVRIAVERGRVATVHTRDGEAHTAGAYVSNIDPARTVALLDPPPARWALAYPYSTGSFTLYLGVRGLDLRDHGFGRWNVWHYPHADLDRLYADTEGEPWLFLATPSLHSDAPGLTPPGHQLLEVATSCDHARFARLKAAGSAAYTAEKVRLRERILDTLEARYVPGLRRHLALRVVGSATTNARYCWAPEGNAYGRALTPDGLRRVPFHTPYPNLYLCNATAGWPSVAGAVRSGTRLYERLARGT